MAIESVGVTTKERIIGNAAFFSESSISECEDKKDRLKPQRRILSRNVTIRRFPGK